MSTKKRRTLGKPKPAAIVRFRGRPVKSGPKPPAKRGRSLPAAAGETVRKRAEVDAALAKARKSHDRLREAIDILPQGIVFLDAEGRYILWNKKYAEMYARSSDLFKPGARLEDTIRVGVARGDYPEAIGREEEWIAARLQKLFQPGERHEQTLADGRVILIDKRLTEDGIMAARRYHRVEAAGGLVPAAVRQQSGSDDRLRTAMRRILAVNDAAISTTVTVEANSRSDDPQPAGLRRRTAMDGDDRAARAERPPTVR